METDMTNKPKGAGTEPEVEPESAPAPGATPQTAVPPEPPKFTSTGAPVDDRFSHEPEDGRPQHLKNAVTEQAPQPLKKNEEEAEEDNGDGDPEGRKGSKKRR
jgi:hypothetical protein